MSRPALASGTPLIGIPLQPEQDANVVLAERLGAARRIPLAQAGSPLLTSTAAQLLRRGVTESTVGWP